MADKKISQLTGASTPLAGTEVLPIVQSGSTVKVSSDDLTVKNVRSNATSGILQIAGPAAAATRTMTVPDANFTVARTDAAQNFTGNNTFDTSTLAIDSTNDRVGVGLTNPSYRLHVQGVAGAVSGTARATVLIDDTTAYAANVGGAITLRGKYNAAGDYVAGGYVQAQKTNATDGNDSFDVVLGTRENGNSTAEALRLTDTKDVKVTTGNLLIGTSGKGINDANNNELFKFTATASAVNELTVANAATGNAPTVSATGGDTNIGITLTPKGSGNVRVSANEFLVGATSAAATGSTIYSSGAAKFISDGQATANTVTNAFTNSNANNTDLVEFCVGQYERTCMYVRNFGAGAGNTISHIVFQYGGTPTTAGSITSVGSTVTYGSASDVRLKNDLGVSKTSRIADVVIHDFEWKSTGVKAKGAFAQELHEVAPEAVVVGKDDVNDNGELKMPWQVDYSKLIPDLIVEVQSLRKRVAELEAAKNGSN